MLERRPIAALAIGLGLLGLAAPGCGGGEVHPSAPSRAAASTVETTLYLLTADRTAPIGVRRAIPRSSPRALAALRALLAGPTPEERRRGLTTALPADTRVISFRIEDHTTAVVDLARLPTDGADGVDRVRIITQITRSLVGLSGIERVALRSDGEPWGLWLMDGGIDSEPYDYGDMVGFFHVCAARPGTEAVPGDCFSALP